MKPQGFSLIEVMVTVAILSIGLLGLAGLQARGLAAQKEAYQRAQALALLKDMAGRIQSNRNEAKIGNYVATGANTRGTGYNGSAFEACAALVGRDLDLCEWHNSLLGAASGTATLTGARGCIDDITAATPNTMRAYRVAIAWQGYATTVAPSVTCGQGTYGANDARRRVVTINVTVPLL
jgi:type IV pilus assembly protein PilV